MWDVIIYPYPRYLLQFSYRIAIDNVADLPWHSLFKSRECREMTTTMTMTMTTTMMMIMCFVMLIEMICRKLSPIMINTDTSRIYLNNEEETL